MFINSNNYHDPRDIAVYTHRVSMYVYYQSLELRCSSIIVMYNYMYRNSVCFIISVFSP